VPALPSARQPAGYFALSLGADASAGVTVLAGQAGGGSVYADVFSEIGPDSIARKHLGPALYESFVLPVGLVMSEELLEWVMASWAADPPEKDGAVLALDHQLHIKSQARFTASLITETSFPTLDAASKAKRNVTLRVQPAAIQLLGGSGTLSLLGAKQKLWLAANFRLEIGGLDCTHVRRIDSFTIRRALEIEPQEDGPPNLVPGRVEFPNLRITLGQAWAETWYDWHEQFVVDGHNDEGFEKTGTLSFLAADLQTELSRIELRHLGIVRLAPAEDEPLFVTAELYCEEMELVQP
jgi:hypothetical protein